MFKSCIFLVGALVASPLAEAQIFQRELGDFDLKLGTAPSRSMAGRKIAARQTVRPIPATGDIRFDLAALLALVDPQDHGRHPERHAIRVGDELHDVGRAMLQLLLAP